MTVAPVVVVEVIMLAVVVEVDVMVSIVVVRVYCKTGQWRESTGRATVRS